MSINKISKIILYICLFILSISFILVGLSIAISSQMIFTGIINIILGLSLIPVFRNYINTKFKPKFSAIINKNNNHTNIGIDIYYGISKFFIVSFIYLALLISGTILDAIILTKLPQPTKEVKTTQNVKTVDKNNIQAPQKTVTQTKINNKPIKSESNYYSVANTLDNYYTNYFNSNNWYVNTVIPIDKTIHVSMIVVDATWQENIKKYSSSRQYMVNCACPNSYTDIWQKIKKSDVSVTIYDIYGKRIGGGVCTN